MSDFPWEVTADNYKEIAEKLKHSVRGRFSNDRGLEMEKMILQAAEDYLENNRCRLVKIPEPFRVLKKSAGGKASIQFTTHAEPDFIGCLCEGGRCIAFESKYTSGEVMKYSALTGTQAEALEKYYKLGAVSGVCCGIQDKYYFVPWRKFGYMKEYFGRLYVKHEDIKQYEVRFTGHAIRFLDYKNGIPVEVRN